MVEMSYGEKLAYLLNNENTVQGRGILRVLSGEFLNDNSTISYLEAQRISSIELYLRMLTGEDIGFGPDGEFEFYDVIEILKASGKSSLYELNKSELEVIVHEVMEGEGIWWFQLNPATKIWIPKYDPNRILHW